MKNTKLGAFELAQNITTEEMAAVFFDKKALREPNYRLCQLNAKGQRYYYVSGEGNKLYPSVTTILKKVMPENKYLTDWRIDLGKEASTDYTMDRARFGTFVHSQLPELMVSRTYDLDSVKERLSKYIEREKLPYSFIEHEEEAKCAILSFAKWMKDYDVRPIAMEISLYHPELGFAGMLDCVADIRKYPIGGKSNERVMAIVDFKTTTKDFRDEHIIQLGLYKLMWDSTFDIKIDALANISPKAWWNTAKKAVSYNFEWQTDSPVLKQIPFLIELYKLLPVETRKVPIMGGVINLDNEIEDNVIVMTLEEIIEEREKNPFEEYESED